MSKQKTNYTKSYANPIEKVNNSGRFYSGDKPKTVSQQVKAQIDGIEDDFLAQLLGYDYKDPKTKMRMPSEQIKKDTSGDMQQGQSVDFASQSTNTDSISSSYSESMFIENTDYYSEQRERKPEVLAGIDYRREVMYGSESLTKREAAQLQQRVQEIIDELSRLVSASVILQTQFSVSVDQAPQSVGKYHINFFEWMLIWVKELRRKTEDAGSWLSVMQSKKSQKTYGKMAKKMGTKFTLANERTPATQTG